MKRRPGPIGIPWDDIAALLDQGWDPRDIAIRLGCSSSNIYDRIRRRRAPEQDAEASA